MSLGSNTGTNIFSDSDLKINLRNYHALFDWVTYYLLLLTRSLVRCNHLAAILLTGPY